jgi:hypothetical protein
MRVMRFTASKQVRVQIQARLINVKVGMICSCHDYVTLDIARASTGPKSILQTQVSWRLETPSRVLRTRCFRAATIPS